MAIITLSYVIELFQDANVCGSYFIQISLNGYSLGTIHVYCPFGDYPKNEILKHFRVQYQIENEEDLFALSIQLDSLWFNRTEASTVLLLSPLEMGTDDPYKIDDIGRESGKPFFVIPRSSRPN